MKQLAVENTYTDHENNIQRASEVFKGESRIKQKPSLNTLKATICDQRSFLDTLWNVWFEHFTKLYLIKNGAKQTARGGLTADH